LKQALLTVIVIPYTFIAPRKLPSFYHVYAEIILEFFLCFFWLVSFASLGEDIPAVQDGLNLLTNAASKIPTYTGDNPQLDSVFDQINEISEALKCFKAVAVFGALML
jgi:hypothetical protein